MDLPRRAAGGGAAQRRKGYWGVGEGRKSNRGPQKIAIYFSLGSHLSKPNLLSEHDKDQIRTVNN